MTIKDEILRALINGKRIRRKHWAQGSWIQLEMKADSFILVSSVGLSVPLYVLNVCPEEWAIIEDVHIVGVAGALKALLDGKTIALDKECKNTLKLEGVNNVLNRNGSAVDLDVILRGQHNFWVII